jgi:hypothetical protein
MPQDLNPVQVAFVQEAARPTIEKLIRARSVLDAFVLDYDNMQTPIVADSEVLNDAPGGVTPRTDAPNLTGTNLLQLRNFAANMRDQINGVALNSLIELSVRSVEDILRN